MKLLPAEELRGNKFWPGENSVGDPLRSLGGAKAELKDLPKGDVSETAVLVEVVVAVPKEDARDGLNPAAAAAAAAENG